MGPIGLILVSALATAGAAEVTWDSIIRLTTSPASQVAGYSGQRSVVADAAGNIHVVWLDWRDVPYQVWYRRYDAGTSAWLAETALTNRPANCFRPGIACDSAGNVNLAWHVESPTGTGIWAKRYDAAGSHWRADTLIDSTTTGWPQSYPSVACVPGSGDAEVAWYGLPDTGMSSQVFLKERHASAGWDSAMQVSTAAVNHDQVSVAAGRNGDLAVVWCGTDFGNEYKQVFCRRRVGGAWQGVEQVSELPEGVTQYSPVVAIDEAGTVHVAWYGRPSVLDFYQQVFHRLCDSAGWSGIDNVSGARSYDQEFPSIACDAAGRCHVVWCSPAGGEHVQLAYGQRETTGVWSWPMVLTGLDSGDVSYPSIACDSDSGIHVAWYDASSGNSDIYYRRGFTPGAALAESPNGELRATNVGPTIVRGDRLQTGLVILDACGRAVADLGPGVYFVGAPGDHRLVRVVVIE